MEKTIKLVYQCGERNGRNLVLAIEPVLPTATTTTTAASWFREAIIHHSQLKSDLRVSGLATLYVPFLVVIIHVHAIICIS